jgi:hypothetical protein
MNDPRTALTLARPVLCCEHARTYEPNMSSQRCLEICLDCGAHREYERMGALTLWVRPARFRDLTKDLLEHDKSIAAAVAHVGKCGSL